MNLYCVTADKHDYDQYDAFVVWARTPAEAVKVALKATGEPNRFGLPQTWTAKIERAPKVARLILGSFNAG